MLPLILTNDSLYIPLVVPNCTEVNDEMKYLPTYSPSQMEHTSTCSQVIISIELMESFRIEYYTPNEISWQLRVYSLPPEPKERVVNTYE